MKCNTIGCENQDGYIFEGKDYCYKCWNKLSNIDESKGVGDE